MADIVVYSTEFCGYCRRAESLLARKNLPFRKVDVTNDDEKRLWLVNASGGRRTVPVIFINDKPIGGYDELAALERSGQLDTLLAPE